METNDNIEILVHVAAPCRAVDDARYRALAQAYLNFQPGGRTKISGGQPQGDADATIPSSLAEPAPSPYIPFHAPIPSSEATQLPSSPPQPQYYPLGHSFGSVQLSFGSVLDNRNSPDLGGAAREQEIVPSSQLPTQTQVAQDSWVAPPSVIDDSQPVNNTSLLEFSSPSRFFEHLADQLESNRDGRSQRTPVQSQRRALHLLEEVEEEPEESHNGDEEEHEEREEDEDKEEKDNGRKEEEEEEDDDDDDDGQVVLTTSSDAPAPGDIPPPAPSPPAGNVVLETPFPARKYPQLPSSPFDQIIQDTPCQPSKRQRPSSPSRAATSDPAPSPKRHRRSAPISESRSIIQAVSITESADHGDVYHFIRPPNQRHLNYLDRLEIHPTGPPVGSTRLTPDDLLTPRLRDLARQLNISKRYRPAEQARELRPFERGHWLLDWTTWRPTLRERAWHFLTDYILDGFAGWGVWCMRAADWSWLRVYCWGHVVGHVYLALYLASERALKTDSARWVDGAGEVVVITNGHENSESGDSMEDGAE
ncbi:hypothetical protein CkaCkLH20_02653 [Colletotrichum karsti]|uniref:Uncharacterized protein n=1 Tax=Colletotrichum karsti TaxID=1095194 RepID=A0A9P6LPN7_9PEZI|nr:uncharacterized protein CkaCkLH20_02653 [Colletotrichum karsti]KAF9879842.1 hypothetical protein CkaCkLH20_02653 [Colletotrichum karsti]